MPALFLGHGSPMNSIEDNEFSRLWTKLGQSLPRPKAILCISAHWETAITRLTAMDRPRTIHDFRGFPKALFDLEYNPPGAPFLLDAVAGNKQHPVLPDYDWGLDHGSWSILCRMYPEAGIPVAQLSLDVNKSPAEHYQLGKSLAGLRDQGVLIIGSGNIVHNLGRLDWSDTAQDWAISFDDRVKQLILSAKHEELLNYAQWGAYSTRFGHRFHGDSAGHSTRIRPGRSERSDAGF